jgi:NAD(P)-dependent dehydrogenase (short-subunit alcohol dehydrogenase family)
MALTGKLILITGAARRIGRVMAIEAARAGADVIIHYHHSAADAASLRDQILALGRRAFLIEADLADPNQITPVMEQAFSFGRLFALVNNAAIFEPADGPAAALEAWNRHLAVNLTAPFLLSQAFDHALKPGEEGRIVNLLDWRSFRTDPGHLAYTVSKAALASLTTNLAAALAPRITVNGLALGAVMAPVQGAAADVLDHVPMRRWSNPEEVSQALLFLLDGPASVTGDVLFVDGGRHLV